jgi:ribulose-bisphosphate carboxylase large chain
VNSFLGPQFGLEGIRKLLKVNKRPLTSLVAKPSMGMNPEEYSKTAYLAWLGGMDFFRDSDNFTNDELNKFEERLSFTIKAREKVEKHHGEKKVFIPNITAETRDMLRRTKKVYDHGSEHILINVSATGWGALQTLRDITDDLKIAIHVQNILPASMTRDPKNGISMLVASDIARLLGVDQLYIGSVIEGVNPMEKEILMEPEIFSKFTSHKDPRLKDEIYGLNSVMPVTGGGIHPGIIPELMKAFGDNDFVMHFCDTVYMHPDGTRDGSAAMRQAIDATLKAIPLKVYAKNHIELWESLKQWGSHSV